MLSRLVALLFLSFMAVSSLFLFVGALLIWLITRWFDPRLVLLHMYTSAWASLYVWIMPAWRVQRSGRDNIDWERTYVVVSNHQSLLDILLAFGLFFPFKWVSKIEIFRVPFIGWNMSLNRYISLKRGDKDSIAEMMGVAESRLLEGSSIYMFPEGTRSPSGVMKPFKLGAFTLAKKLEVPILPIVINGSKNSLPKHSLNFHGKHQCRIDVLPAIEPQSFAELSAEQLAEVVYQRIANHVDEHTLPATSASEGSYDSGHGAH